VAGEPHSQKFPPPTTSIAALRRILETVDEGTQPHAYGVLRAQLDEAIARKMTDQVSKRRA
jgi:hypothetical protein